MRAIGSCTLSKAITSAFTLLSLTSECMAQEASATNAKNGATPSALSIRQANDIPTESIESCQTALRQLLESEMDSEIAHIAKTAGLDEPTIGALQVASAALIEDQVKHAVPAITEYILALTEWARINRANVQSFGIENVGATFSRRSWPMFGRNPGNPPIPKIPMPWRDKVWSDKVQSSLKPDQQKALAEFLADDATKADKAIKAGDPLIRKRLGIEAAILRSRIERAVELDPDRLARFHALLDKALDHGTAATLARLREFVDALPRSSREQWQGNLSNVSGLDHDIETDPIWKEGIDSLLSQAERDAVQASMRDRLDRLRRILADLTLRDMDNRCRLSPDQKTRLLPLVERAVLEENKDVPNAESKMGPAVLFSGMRNRTRGACDHLAEKELREILDARQFELWKEQRERNTQRIATFTQRNSRKVEPKPAKPPPPADPEALIQEHLAKSAEAQREQLRSAMLNKVDEIARDASVDAVHTERLRTAALGAVEFHLRNWKPNFENNLRANLHNVRPDALADRLGNFGFFMMGGSPLAPQSQAIWKNAYGAELTDAQRQRLNAAAQERKEDLAKTVAGLTTWIFERHTALRPAQIPPVRDLVAKSVLEYLPDLEQAYGTEDSESPWYNHLHSVVLPLFGVAETELKQILSPSQWERWSKSELHNSFGSNWTNIKSLHESRKVRQKQ